MLGETPGAVENYQRATATNLEAAKIAQQAAERWRWVLAIGVAGALLWAVNRDIKRGYY